MNLVIPACAPRAPGVGTLWSLIQEWGLQDAPCGWATPAPGHPQNPKSWGPTVLSLTLHAPDQGSIWTEPECASPIRRRANP